jgi:hypothetical protein
VSISLDIRVDQDKKLEEVIKEEARTSQSTGCSVNGTVER